MTENLFRFEHSTSKKFENRPTVSVINRGMFWRRVTKSRLFDTQSTKLDHKKIVKKRKDSPIFSIFGTLSQPITDFKSFEQDGKLVILTQKFNITYVVGSGLKSPEDLR